MSPAAPSGVRLLIAGALVVVLSASGCSSPAQRQPTSSGARHALERSILFIMNESGLPVQYDQVGCLPGPGARADSCYANTEDTPAEEVRGQFAVAPSSGSSVGCPGTLTVKVGTTVLTRHPEDPCR